MLLLAMLTGVWFNIAVLLFLLVCFVLVLTVMIQKPQGGGLSAAFGASSGSGQTAFGTKTGDALTVATILVFVVWLALAVALNIMSRPSEAPPVTVTTPPAETVPETPADPAATPAVNPPAPGVNPPANPAATPESPVEKPVQPNPAPADAAPATPGNPAPANPTPAPAPAPGEAPR
ncbi:MAG: preprotein translocase subunit SecG [Tepidisphaera sp.]